MMTVEEMMTCGGEGVNSTCDISSVSYDITNFVRFRNP